MSDTYADVDGSGHIPLAIGWQEAVAAWPAVQAYKQRTWDALAAAQRILDVGSGPGDDLLGLGPDRAIGVDRSAAMCRRARERGATAIRGDAHRLPFGDAAFTGARADRTIQHLDDPDAAVAELVRVTEPGGTVVVADPDQATLAIEVPGVRPSVVRRIEDLRRDVAIRNGRWIRDAPAILERHGAEVTAVESFALELHDPADAFGLPTWPQHWQDVGPFTDDELAEWDDAVASPTPGFRYRLDYVVVIARLH